MTRLLCGALILAAGIGFGHAASVINTNDSGAGSLRQAILDTNNSPGLDTITFSIPGSGVKTITPATQLPFITSPVVIDGSTQPGFNGTPLIEISGAILTNNANGLTIDSGGGGSTIRSLIVNHSWSAGILLQASNCVIEGCFIGTDATGTLARGNTQGIGTSFGVTAANNLIGGTTAAARNLISANQSGVVLTSGASNNLIEGNFIGTDVTGDNALANLVGVDLRDNNNVVGGNNTAARNIIAGSGSSSMGVVVGTSSGNVIQGNFIGTDRTGTKAFGFTDGIFLNSTATNTQIGGLTSLPGTPPGNVISGNSEGIFILLNGSSNTIQGNLIGTNASGTAGLGNSLNGIHVEGASNLIGGSTATARNVVSANGRGIFFGTNNGVVHDNIIQNNFIGTGINGTQLLGNGLQGIYVIDSNNNTIGGASTSLGNVIAGNGGSGVGVDSTFGPVTNLRIRGNSIFANGGLGIDLAVNGVTSNDAGDADDGPNHLQNFPVITNVSKNGGTIQVSGTLNSTAATTFHLEFFATTPSDPSGFGEGQVFLTGLDVMTNLFGDAGFTLNIPQLAAGQLITATATDPNGNTSEFSNAFAPPPPAAQLANISTRLRVLTGDSIGIGGFIIDGSGNKNVLVRGLGPTLSQFQVPGVLNDPTLALHTHDVQGNDIVVATNDNWKVNDQTQQSQEAAVNATGFVPSSDAEAAILLTLAPGAYTALLSGKNETSGVGLMEVYDLDSATTAFLSNISTRGFVDTGDNVMIGGFILAPSTAGNATVLVRSLGPTLATFNVSGTLSDPTLELHDANGTLIDSNDDWQQDLQANNVPAGLRPPDPRESALQRMLAPAGYTAIVRGKNDSTGVAIVEVYYLP